MKQLAQNIMKTVEAKTNIRFFTDQDAVIRYGGAYAANNYRAFYSRVEDMPFTFLTRAIHSMPVEAIVFNTHHMITNHDSVSFIKTLFHELGHATGHRSRFCRLGVYCNANVVGLRDCYVLRAIEELVAERIAQKLSEYFQIEDHENRARSIYYVQLHCAIVESQRSELSEFEAYQVELDAELGYQYILKNWVSDAQSFRKVA